jgi:hypothetical protein
MKNTYYIHYTTKNNLAHREILKNSTLDIVIKYINQVLKPVEYSLFDFDTQNTSEPKGLVAFSANPRNYFYNNINK